MKCKVRPRLTLDDLRASRSAVVSRVDIAAVLDVDPRTITTAIANGTIPSIRLGSRVVIPREKFLALFDVEGNGNQTHDDVDAVLGGGRS